MLGENIMKFSAKREFELLSKIGFVRTSGTSEEKRAAEILLDEIKAIGVEGKLEPFKVDLYEIKKAKFEVLEPYYMEYTVNGYGMSGSTPQEGFECEFEYVENADMVNLVNAKDKIVLINSGFNAKAYENMIKAGVKGFVSYSGTVIDDESKTDLEDRKLNERHLKHGKIPALTIRAKDAMELVRKMPTKVRMTLEQTEGECDSHNVIASIKGSMYENEEIHFVAHYDSVPFSNGVYDNGAGSVIIMELLRYYHANPPKRTVKFIWFGSEERGLLGSKYYTNTYEEDLKKVVLAINVDMAGPILGVNRAFVTADNSLLNMVEYMSKEIGFPISAVQDVYSSDSTPYADKGVPAISFARFGANGGAPGHNRYDLIEHLSADNLLKLTEFIHTFSERTINACVFPVPREIPQNMIDAVDKYLAKDKKKDNK
jgi:hypothetical protein